MDSLLLHIYDATDRSIRLTSWLRRNSWGANVYPVPIEGGLEGLRVALRDLVSAGKTFDRCLFETHGSEGQISFGHEALAMSNIDSWLANQGYDRLFPHRSRIYFNGCNIADNDKGWDFLDAAGRIFLRIGGGETFAQTRFGTAYPWNWLNGHIYHIGSQTCYSRWYPGGVFRDHVRE